MGFLNLSSQKTQHLVSSIEESRRHHVAWLNDFNKQLISVKNRKPVNLGCNECCFLDLYYSINDEILRKHDVFIKIENTHKSLHEIANRLIEKHEINQPITSEEYDLFIAIELEFMKELDIIYSFIKEAHHSMDKLTNLPNKSFMLSTLKREYALLKREKIESSLVFADIDFFKRINDKYGHLIGDKVLNKISMMLITNLREYDIASRFGGEEFLIFLHHISPAMAKTVAERIRQNISDMDFNLSDHNINHITCSFGISSFTLDFSLKQNIVNSDTALYLAKEKGRNRVEVYNNQS